MDKGLAGARGAGGGSSRKAALARAEAMVEGGRFAQDLAALVAFETESQDPRQAPELRRYLLEGLAPRLERLGVAWEVVENPDGRGGPALLGERREGEGGPVVLTYGHGDVIRGQAEGWREGLHPFRLQAEGERLYGRGTADNKGQHLLNLLALEAVMAERAVGEGGRLGFDLRLLVETSEETGSPGLHALARAHRDRLAADVLIASDGPRLRPGTPTLFGGARGALAFDLVVRLREGAQHSGNWGGALADPAQVLAHALSAIADRWGRLLVPEWRPPEPSPEIRAALDALPAPEGGPAPDVGWGEEWLSLAERLYAWNGFAVLAMTSGRPEAPVNAIAGEARATCQLRFVADTDPEDILPALRRHLDREGFGEGFRRVEIRPLGEGLFRATRLDPRHPWMAWAAASAARSAGRAPHVLPNLAGSLPNDVFADLLGMPTVWVPHSYAGCSQHAPDEHLLLPVARDAIRVMAGLWWDLGEPGTPGRAG